MPEHNGEITPSAHIRRAKPREARLDERVTLARLLLVFISAAAWAGHAAEPMQISSPAFADGATIPAKFTADGADINPALVISGVPAGAKSLVLIMDDPDAPGGTWNHWLLWNLGPATTTIAEDSTPAGAVAGRNDFGETLYRGPSPPSGTHRYFFRLLALDTKLDLPAGADRAALDRAVKDHVLARAVLMGLYSR